MDVVVEVVACHLLLQAMLDLANLGFLWVRANSVSPWMIARRDYTVEIIEMEKAMECAPNPSLL